MQVVRFELEGRLNARRVIDPGRQKAHVFYDAAEVETLMRDWKPKRQRSERIDNDLVRSNMRGKVGAQVFRMLDAHLGKMPVDALFRLIIVETAADPALVRALWREWDLAIEGDKREKEKQRRENEDRQTQLRYERAQTAREVREHKLKLAQIEAKRPPAPQPPPDAPPKEKTG